MSRRDFTPPLVTQPRAVSHRAQDRTLARYTCNVEVYGADPRRDFNPLSRNHAQ
jgi:hypothetical protein